MSLLKGTVRSYNAGAGTAEVELVGSHGQYVTVPVATDLDSKTVVVGKKCAVLSFDDRDSGDAVLVATYDDTYMMGGSGSSTDDHDHTGDAGDGGQLEADLSLLATGDAATKVLTPDGANAVQWSDVPVHASRHQNAGADEVSVAGLSGLLADGQTPLAHKTSHENAGGDEVSVADLSGLLADGQTPLDHDHTGDAGDGGKISIEDLGDYSERLTSQDFYGVGASPAHGVLGHGSTNEVPTWRFDDTSEEMAGTSLVYRGTGGGSTIYVDVYYAMESATSGAVVWIATLDAVADGEDFNAVGSNGNVADNVPGTAKYLGKATVTVTETYAQDDVIRLTLTRWASVAGDTATGDAHLVAVNVRFG